MSFRAALVHAVSVVTLTVPVAVVAAAPSSRSPVGSRASKPAPQAPKSREKHWLLAITTPAASVVGQAPLPYKDLWGAQPASSALVDLSAVSCANVFFCAAVGQYQDATGAQSGLLDVLWRGRWRAYAAPEPAVDPAGGTPGISGPTSGLYSGLQAVSCPAVGRCTAVGSYRDSQGQVWGLIETFQDGRWAPAAAPEPARNVAGEGPGEVQTYSGLGSISCTSPTFCVAVGMYNDAAEFSYGLIDTYQGGRWAALAAPEPALDGAGQVAGSDSSGEQAGDLSAIACPASERCVAVGDYRDAAGNEWPLIDQLAGTSWTAAAPPEPMAPATHRSRSNAPVPDAYAFLSGIACAGATSCSAAGAYADPGHHRYGLLETLSDGRWQDVSAPEPERDPSGVGAGTATDDEANATLAAVGCLRTSYCVAVGDYKDAKGEPTGLLEVYDRGSWAGFSPPLPRRDALGGGPALDVSGEAEATFTTAWCGAGNFCVSAGAYDDNMGNSVGLIAQLGSKGWQAVVAPAPQGPFQLGITARQAVAVNDVSCAPDGTCALVGTYEDGQGNTFGLIDRYRV